MKKMMTNMKTLVALLMAGAAVTSCSSDNEMDSLKAPAGKTYTMTVQATKGDDATTRALADGGTTLTSTWSKDDVVEVWSEDGTTTKYGELTATAAGASTTLTGALTTAPTDQETLTLKYLSPSYSQQDGTLTGTDNSIDKKCDYATATVTATVSGDKVTTGVAAFQHQQAVVKFTLVDKANTSTKLSPTALTINDGSSDIVTLTSIPAETYTTNGEGVLYVALPAVSSKPITLTATVGSDTYTLTTSSAKSFANGSFYRVTAKMAEPEVVGYFTSKSDGTKVVFSPGNLQYQASTDTWRFAEHQYDYVGDDTKGNVYVGSTKSNNANISQTYDGWIDLFGWGTSNKTFASGYGTYYQPWSTSMEYGDYGPTGTSNGLYGDYANGDWGVNMTGPYTWRTLTGGTGGEWEYIFSTRTSGATVNGVSNARYTEATINTDGTPVNGMILFPDGCEINSSSATSWGNINSASTWENATKCTEAQWTHLEKLGCVFLPAAGFRDDHKVDLLDSYGIYFSSSPHASNSLYAHIVRIYSGGVDPATFGNRCSGFSVRLVREVPSN